MLRMKVFCVDPNTPKNKPKQETWELPRGILYSIQILIPPGHFALAGVRIRYGLEILVPYHQDEWIRGDDMVVPTYLEFPLENDPTELIIEGYNEDAKYTHCFYLFADVRKEDQSTSALLKYFLRKLGLLR